MVTTANDPVMNADQPVSRNLCPTPLWAPADVSIYQASKFMNFVNEKYNLNLSDYIELHKWSCTDISNFWASVWDFTQIISHSPYTEVYEQNKPMDENPLWFVGSKLNYAENLIERWKDSDKIAIYSRGEQTHSDITFTQLYSMVSKVAAAFKGVGLKKCDRVASYTTNCVEAIVGMLATASIGAIWSSSSVDFGVTAVIDRFSQIEPTIFISIDQSCYNAKVFSHLDKINQIVKNLPSVKTTIIIDTFNQSETLLDIVPGCVTWSSLLDIEKNALCLEYEMMSFNDPLFILFSSGTTGKPKCLVHRVGGILIQHLKEHKIILNVGQSDIFFYYTTTGWMMWNYLVSVLALGSTIVLYEGSPMGPSPGVLWDLAEELKFTVFGTSAKYIQYLEDVSYKPMDQHNLESIKTILSTASPLKPNSYDFVYNHIKKDVLLGSISGGTDICSVFVGSCHILPVYKGEITCPLLGMAIECWDANGEKVSGVSGDMVCVKPFPCMPAYFWGDSADNARYKSSYFENDGTLNPNGIRFGSAEIYNIVEKFEFLADSLVVGQQIDQNERVILFIKTKDGAIDHTNEEELEKIKNFIKKEIRTALSPRHVPAKIVVVEKIPYTTNGKKIEVAVKSLLNNCYILAEEYRTKHQNCTLEQVGEYVENNIVIDKSKVIAVADFDSIVRFSKIKEILY
ncbi:hypothetical protein BB561_003422 [Smittium simulii]|uniref:AMP-dependent synthetase/ligase domain-containing protein n=1 Tax=Smittium simulii TaxID=133385 RepID=A0A2T9YLH5_9FUNG|nr:hypothetical protein BB561_003422 [Smittium simulii]